MTSPVGSTCLREHSAREGPGSFPGIFTLILLVLTTLACVTRPDTSRTYRIGFGGDKPLHYLDSDGQPNGLAVDLVQASARRRGIRLQWVFERNALEALKKRDLDLFVLMAVLPERLESIHFTEPYLVTETAFLVAQNTPYRTVRDLSSARIAFNDVEVHRITMAKTLPRSTAVMLGSTAEAIRAVQDGRADAAYVDQYAGMIGLMDGVVTRPLRLIGSGVPVRQLAMASTFANQAVADALRDEISKVSERHQLAPILAKWSMFPTLIAESADALNAERQRTERLSLGAALLTLLLLGMILLTWRLRQRNRSLTEGEARLRSLTDTAFEGVMTHDGAVILDANRQLASLFGYDDPGELIGVRGIRLLDDASVAAVKKRFSGGVFLKPIEVVGIRKDGSTFHAETQGCDSVFHGKKVRVVAMRDISERRQMEQDRTNLERQLVQAQKMESVGRLAGGISHDFNNLLTVINGYCDLALRDQALTDKLRGRVQHVRTAGERATELTRQLLAFSRRQVVEPQPLDINALVIEVQAMLAHVVPANIEIVTYLDEKLSWVMADTGQLHQVLMNLALNARDAMPHGGTLVMETRNVVLDASYAAEHPEVVEGPCVLLAVSDNGSGMPADVVEHAFEPFFTTKPSGAGTGLGLATVYGIVRQSGGWIWLYSELGKGSSFKIYLPVLTTPTYVPRPVPEVQAIAGKTILVVDDQTELRNFIIEVLEDHGYHVLAAGTGEAALLAAREFKENIDLLLTDVVMPGITGKELASQLHQERSNVRVVYMSGYTENVIVNRGVLKPGIAYLPKPLTPDSLLQKVAEALGAPPPER